MFVFPLAPSALFQWHQEMSVSSLSRVLAALSFTFLDETATREFWNATVYMALFWMVWVLALASWVGFCYANENTIVEVPIKVA